MVEKAVIVRAETAENHAHLIFDSATTRRIDPTSSFNEDIRRNDVLSQRQVRTHDTLYESSRCRVISGPRLEFVSGSFMKMLLALIVRIKESLHVCFYEFTFLKSYFIQSRFIVRCSWRVWDVFSNCWSNGSGSLFFTQSTLEAVRQWISGIATLWKQPGLSKDAQMCLSSWGFRFGSRKKTHNHIIVTLSSLTYYFILSNVILGFLKSNHQQKVKTVW